MTLVRALARFAPEFASIGEADAGDLTNVKMSDLQRAREAIREGVDPTEADNFDADLDLARAGIDAIDVLIEKKRAAQSEAARTAQPVAGQARQHGTPGGGTPRFRGASPVQFRDAASGQLIRAFRHDEPIAGDRLVPDFGIGDVIRANLSGNWSHVPSEVRAASLGSGASGAFMVPSDLSGYVVDLARARARVMEAGALSLAMPHGNLSVAVVNSDPEAGWRPELGAIKVSQGTYGRLELRSKMLAVLVPVSLELAMSAANFDQLVTGQIIQKMALQLDAAAIAGDGTQDQPRGIVANLPADHVIDVGAALSSPTTETPAVAYNKWNSAIGRVLGANADLASLSILHNSDVEVALDDLVDTTGQPLMAPPNYRSIRDRGAVRIANGILTEGDPASTYSVVGDFAQCLFGIQSNMMLQIEQTGSYTAPARLAISGSPIEAGDTVSAFGRAMVLIRAMMLVDVAVMKPDHFAKVNDIRFA